MSLAAIIKKSPNLFLYLLLLTTVFLLAEISFFIQCTQVYFHDFHMIADRIPVPASIIPGILFFIFSHLLIHLGFAALLWLVALFSASGLKLSPSAALKWGLGVWVLSIVSIFVANQYFIPNSKFAELSRYLFPELILPYLLILLSVLDLVVLILALYSFVGSLSLRNRLQWLTLLWLALAYLAYQNYFLSSLDASTPERPNIILIGVDSVRPDFVNKTPTVFFSPFLQQSTVFTNAFTPLARTFPSWMSILSGLYPKESGIRFNLAAEGSKNNPLLLSTILRNHGYRTIYATDETQFSNIDQNFGFDELVAPPMGLNDFLLGTFNDFPLSNLLVNTVVGKWLFPHSYGNRPSFMTYDPNSFLALIKTHLQQPRQKPLFLSVHFCLTHYPYLWRSHSSVADTDPINRYQAAIGRVDQQVNDFMAMLDHYQILQHAIVVLLSDHGEALELRGDRITAPASYVPLQEGKTKIIPRFYPPSVDTEAVNQSVGHGTDVLGFPQYHSLLAFHLYGLGKQAVKSISNYVLLLDIKPTLLNFLGIADKSSGLSLQKLILGKSNSLPERKGFFLESDFSPEAVRSVHPQTRNLIFEGIDLFTIDPATTRIFVREGMAQLIISSKQYATIDHDWVLALYPRQHGKMIPVLVHLPSGRWTTDLRTAFAQNSPQKRMLKALKNFYGKEIKQLAAAH